MQLRKITSAILLMGAAGMANAAFVFTAPIDYDFGPEQTNWTHTFQVAQFNPLDHGGARLNSVHIENYSASLESDGGSVTCFAPGLTSGNCTGSVNASVTVGLSGAGIGISASVAIPTFNYNFAGATNPPPFSSQPIPAASELSAPQGVWYCIVSDMAGCIIDPAVVAAFEGTGTVGLLATGNGLVTAVNSDGQAGADFPLLGDVRFQLRYDYQENVVPEPASMVLMGLALAGLGVSRRRKV